MSAAAARYIQVDLYPAELGRSPTAHTPVTGDVCAALGQLPDIIRPRAAGSALGGDPRVDEVTE